MKTIIITIIITLEVLIATAFCEFALGFTPFESYLLGCISVLMADLTIRKTGGKL